MTERVYFRTLPGGGYVAIDVTCDRRWLRPSRYLGTVVVERRVDGERHRKLQPVIIADASGPSMDAVLQSLLPAAECNPAIGSALLRRTSGRRPASGIGVRRPRLARNVGA